MAIILIFSGIFGLLVGSFLNAALWRMYSGESIVFGRSHCVRCKHTLSWYELIPIASFLIQRGRCRVCKKNISWQYPAVELTTALLFVGALFVVSSVAIAPILYLWIISATLLFIFVYDLRHYIIPDSALLIIIISTLVALASGIWQEGDVWGALLAGVLLALPFFGIVLFSRGRWMGMGDAKLAFVMGLILGLLPGFIAIFLASILGAIIGVGLVLVGRKTMKSAIPFGPFLIAGTVLSFLFSDVLITWYGRIFFF